MSGPSDDDARKIEQQIRTLARRADCPRHMLDDVVQETFVQLLSRPSFLKLGLDDGRRGAAIQSATLRAMKIVSGQVMPESAQHLDTIADSNDSPQSEAQEKQELMRMLDYLDARDSDIVELTLRGYTQSEIARDLGMTRQAVHQRMEEIRAKICRERNVNYNT